MLRQGLRDPRPRRLQFGFVNNRRVIYFGYLHQYKSAAGIFGACVSRKNLGIGLHCRFDYVWPKAARIGTAHGEQCRPLQVSSLTQL